MKKLVTAIMLLGVFAMYAEISAQTTTTPPTQHGKNFVDKNGDGYNDNAPDADGDGIPNGVDPDYTGAKVQKNKFVDLNGDGINDNAGKGKKGSKSGKGGLGAAGKGMKNGTQNCTPTGTQTGTQSGTGNGYRGGRK
ncbi:MAG: hypothetical protein Q8S39_09685 [Ignavibacteria bacterium]|nr:hypothetical protein [Ignavibacteria bacterium]